MLYIKVDKATLWDEHNEQFVDVKEQTLQLEHSLVSISKWEAKWHVPFFSKKDKTPEQTIDYIKCMTISQNIKPEVYACLSKEKIDEINSYISNPMTATTFMDNNRAGNNSETITSELIYYWMIALNIPVEFQKWHINRLLTLIRVCNIKNQPPKKMSKGERLRQQAELNAQRRRQLNTKG